MIKHAPEVDLNDARLKSNCDEYDVLKESEKQTREYNARLIVDLKAARDELARLRKSEGVLSQESFDECYDESEASIEEYELSKLVMQAVKNGRQKLRNGECLYVSIDLPRIFKPAGDQEFPVLTAMRVYSPDRDKASYEIHVG